MHSVLLALRISWEKALEAEELSFMSLPYLSLQDNQVSEPPQMG